MIPFLHDLNQVKKTAKNNTAVRAAAVILQGVMTLTYFI